MDSSLHCLKCNKQLGFQGDGNYPVVLSCKHTVCLPCICESLSDKP